MDEIYVSWQDLELLIYHFMLENLCVIHGLMEAAAKLDYLMYTWDFYCNIKTIHIQMKSLDIYLYE